MLGALRGWADDDGDGAVTVDEATLFTRSTLQSAFKGDERLPQRRGPSFVLARGARERRPDVDGIVRATTASATRQLPAAAVATRLVVLPVRAAVAVDELRQPVMRAAARAAERLGLGVLDTEGYAKIATAAGCPIGDVDCGFRATRTQGAKVGLGLSFADEAVRATVLDVDGRVLGRASHPLSSGAGAAAREAAIGSVVDAAVTSALAGGPAAVTPAPASPAPPKSPTPPTPPKPSSSRSLSSPDSRVVLDFPCNIIRGIEGVGSQCTLRRGRLEVRPHPLNLQGAPEDILIVDIDRVEPFSPAGIVPTGVRLWLKDGSRRELVSWQRDQVVNELRALLAE
jgi:hypothetical protein